MPDSQPIHATYADAGVDIDAGERAVQLIKSRVHKTFRSEVIGGIGGFAGLFSLDVTKYRKPLLASSTDGVGTKLAIAQELDIHDTVGIDLVAMVVDDLVVCGAEPLFLQDYVASGRIIPERIFDIVGGIADGCRYAGCSLVGGELAEHPDLLGHNEYDISATGVGVVETDDLLGPEKVVAGDILVALGSSGVHSNGYSLVRHVLLGAGRMRLNAVVDELGSQRTLGEELLTPTRIYAKHCLAVIREAEVHAMSHITGGGIPGNVARLLPAHLDAVIRRSTWRPQPIFDLISERGRVEQPEMERTFNMGMGMVLAVPADECDRAMAILTARHIPCWVAGEVVAGTGETRLLGNYSRG